MALQAAETYGYNLSDKLKEIFTKFHKTHNTAVFDAYTPEMMKVRHAKILTGLPDTYGRGRIVGDYRRVALYGLDYLIEEKKKDKANCGCGQMTDDVIRLREEISDQYKALAGMKKMAESYGMEVDKIKEFMGEYEQKQIREDIAVQKAVDLVVAEAVEK